MARIVDADIKRLKQEVSLLRLVEAAGIELKAHGKDRVGRPARCCSRTIRR